MSKQKTKRYAGQGRAGPTQPAWRRTPAKTRKRVNRAVVRVPADAAQGPRPRQHAASTVAGTGSSLRSRVRQMLLVLLVAVLAVVLVSLLRLPVLAVSAMSTQIGGAERTAPEQVYGASGIEGRNIFLIQASAVSRQVQQLPGIVGAEVHIRLPNRVIIDVHEAAPLVAWQSMTTTVWLTPDGAAVPQTGALPPLHLSDMRDIPFEEGQQPWQPVLGHLAELHSVRPDVTDAYYGEDQGLYFRSPEGWEVWLGDSGSTARKLELLTSAVQEFAALGSHPQVIDLRFSEERAIWW